MMTSPRTSSLRPAKAFTLVELLLAIFLLTIGLIGLLSVFPIGADWTRQITEESIAQSVSRNAISVLISHFNAAEMKTGINDKPNPKLLRAFPNLALKVPVSERAYQYGSPQPFPAQNPKGAAYFWTALARLSPDQPIEGTRYDVFILVMKKGNPGDVYDINTKGSVVTTSAMTELVDARDTANELFVPMAVLDTYRRSPMNLKGEFVDLNLPPNCVRNTPQADDLAIGVRSGTVFRSRIMPVSYMGAAASGNATVTGVTPDPTSVYPGQPILSSVFPAGTTVVSVDVPGKTIKLSSSATASNLNATVLAGTMWTRPQIGQASTQPVNPSDLNQDVNAEGIIWVPPSNPVARAATDTTPSPLIFVYQTTIAF